MRWMTIATAMCLFLLNGSPARALEPLPDYTGLYLIQHCHNDKDAFVRGFCLGYIRSVVDLMMDSEVYTVEKPRFCLGDTPLKDWRGAVLDWIKNRPDEYHTSSRKVIVQALNESFPCTR